MATVRSKGFSSGVPHGMPSSPPKMVSQTAARYQLGRRGTEGRPTPQAAARFQGGRKVDGRPDEPVDHQDVAVPQDARTVEDPRLLSSPSEIEIAPAEVHWVPGKEPEGVLGKELEGVPDKEPEGLSGKELEAASTEIVQGGGMHAQLAQFSHQLPQMRGQVQQSGAAATLVREQKAGREIVLLQVRLRADEEQAFKDAAMAAGITLSAWVTGRLAAAVKMETLPVTVTELPSEPVVTNGHLHEVAESL